MPLRDASIRAMSSVEASDSRNLVLSGAYNVALFNPTGCRRREKEDVG
jgi:hypothetical protein